MTALGRSRIRVAIADDHPVVLAGIKALLQAAPEIDLVGEARDGAAALRLVADERPDVAVVDISLPEMNGLALARGIAAAVPEARVIALTLHEDRAYVQRMLDAGVRGYLLKRSAAEDLVRAVRAVAEGGLYLDPAVAGKALAESAATARAATARAAAADGVLSPREAEVLRFTARGFSNKEIALRFDVSVKTIETHRARAADKLGLRSRAEIVRYAVAKGWLDGLADEG